MPLVIVVAGSNRRNHTTEPPTVADEAAVSVAAAGVNDRCLWALGAGHATNSDPPLAPLLTSRDWIKRPVSSSVA